MNDSMIVDQSSILPQDMTEIVQYDRLADDLVSVNSMSGPMYMRDFLKAKDVAARFHAKAIFEFEQAKTNAKKVWAVAKLDRAPAILTAKGVKTTDGNCEAYADQDPEYLVAKNAEAYWKALAIYLEKKVEKFTSAHDDSRKIFDKTSDPKGSSLGLPTVDSRPFWDEGTYK